MRIERDDALAATMADALLRTDFRGSPYCGLIIKTDLGSPVGVVILNDYAQGNIELTGAGVGCWTPSVIRSIARLIFVDLKCRRVTARAAKSNHRARAALRAIGFKREGLAREWFGKEDAVLYGLLRREQRIVR